MFLGTHKIFLKNLKKLVEMILLARTCSQNTCQSIDTRINICRKKKASDILLLLCLPFETMCGRKRKELMVVIPTLGFILHNFHSFLPCFVFVDKYLTSSLSNAIKVHCTKKEVFC